MSRLLPLRSESPPKPKDGARIVDVEEQAADGVFEALSANTTRAVLTAVYDEPGTATEIAERVDTSLQNAKYHIEKLQDVDLIEIADTWYSEQGNEMKVYAPTNESIVLVAGDEQTQSTIRESLVRLLGAVGALAVGSVVVDRLVRLPGQYQTFTTSTENVESTAPSPLVPTVELGGWLTPGLLFFLGGAFALLAVVVAVMVLRNR